MIADPMTGHHLLIHSRTNVMSAMLPRANAWILTAELSLLVTIDYNFRSLL